MTLTKSTFKVLNALRDEAVHTQRHIATATGLSLGTVNTAYRALVDAGLAENFSVTPAGFEALSPYKVDNAIIMAAGVNTIIRPPFPCWDGGFFFAFLLHFTCDFAIYFPHFKMARYGAVFGGMGVKISSSQCKRE